MNVGAKIFGSPSGEPKHHNQTNAQKKCEKLLTLPIASCSASCSAISEWVAQGNSSQFNSLDFYSCGSGPGGRWFKSTRPDQFSMVQQLTA